MSVKKMAMMKKVVLQPVPWVHPVDTTYQLERLQQAGSPPMPTGSAEATSSASTIMCTQIFLTVYF